MGINFKKDLNQEQYEVVRNGDGAVLVLAGAGSGKTRTLTYRVAYLLEQGVSPQNILLVTFTNKAAKEMAERISLLFGGKSPGIWRGTFHHIGHRLLRKYAHYLDYSNNFSILDREDSALFLKECYSELVDKLEVSRFFPKPKIIYNLLSLARNRGIGIGKLIEESYDYLSSMEKETIEQIEKEYEVRKKKANVMDFDDLLLNWLLLLEKNETIRKKYQNQFKYILIDEYQDTNFIQDKTVELMSAKHKNILVVGDDSQSIYSFRAADINNILNFPKKYSPCKLYKLETNYRSSFPILELANCSIANNSTPFSKKLQSVKSGDKKPVLYFLRDNREQAKLVVRKIKEEGNRSGIAVLFRSAFQSMEVELELNREGIPYIMRGGIRFFEQKHIKDVLAYLRVVANFKDELSWRRILLLEEGIGLVGAQRIWDKVKKYSSLPQLFDESDWTSFSRFAEKIEKILRILKKIEKLEGERRVEEAVNIVLGEWYGIYLKTNFDNHKEREEDLRQMSRFASLFSGLDEFLAEVSLAQSFRGERSNIDSSQKETVVLSTIHQAKGLEWETVFLIGLVEGQFPHRKVFDYPQEMEEERRLFYVAITRAKENLYLTFPTINNQNNNINDLSTFISEVDDNLLEKVDKSSPHIFSDDFPTIEYE